MVMVAANQDKIRSCYPMQFSTMLAEDNTAPRKLKFKITTKGIRDDSGDKSRENVVKLVINCGQGDRVAGVRNKLSEANVLLKSSVPAKSNKRRPETSLDGERGIRRKIDSNLKIQCGNVLKELMNHPDGWIFSEPVDPVKLNIPDYFSVISEPMDLGTIKRKLEGNMYFGAEEFAADVRLTFSNAMLYNPPDNRVHSCAKKLDRNFNRRWKILEAKMQHSKNVEQASRIDYMEKNGPHTKQTVGQVRQDTKLIGLNKAALRIKVGTYKSMSFEEKEKFRLELVQVLSKKMTEKLRNVFQKFSLTGLDKERLGAYIDSADDDTLFKLRREIRVCMEARDGKVTPARIVQKGFPSLRRTVQKEHCGQGACASANHRQSVDSTEAKCSSCVGMSDISSERSSEQDHCSDSRRGSEVKCSLASDTNSSGPDSGGPGVVLDDENSSHLSTPAICAASVEGWNSLDVQMSPKKALRAAMLKTRFADTIFKATHQVLVDHSEKSDPVRLQEEREKLEREQLKEKARIEAEIRAAEEASRRRLQNDLKMQRERERAAARMALEKMGRTVLIDENVDIWKDLEMLCCGSPSDLLDGEGCDVMKVFHPGNLLEQLGLYIKADYLEEDEDATWDGEEGEILS
ncbi:transcription factor GTE9-like isoform X2 [Sesamum indicum]|uniref:Transcription factor GTE9-like isoform X2 n=1 Tax=Sesamum indicum TaxID=4182 RepID=A0A6I9U6V4_SESIN|nr:transcription factor GTE9-like isoform X2 [Sesamum indicum]